MQGVPPFNAHDPQQIFNNILNRNLEWPSVPEDMSYEAKDLIDRLLCEDPYHRLGFHGAEEVRPKTHMCMCKVCITHNHAHRCIALV